MLVGAQLALPPGVLRDNRGESSLFAPAQVWQDTVGHATFPPPPEIGGGRPREGLALGPNGVGAAGGDAGTWHLGGRLRAEIKI